MDQVTKAKVQFRREQWKKIISECQSSGIPVKTWCEQNGFSEQSYYYYLKKIREDELSKLSVPVPTDNTKPAAFKKLEVQTPVPNTRAAVIIHLNGATVEINEGTSQQTIQAVLLALQSVC